MAILNHFEELVDKFKIRFWEKEEQLSLFRVLLEFYHADGVFSNHERADFKEKISGLGISEEDIEIDFGNAIMLLKDDESKMALIHFWIASAIFADNDYDDQEKAFVDKLIQKYHLDGIELNRAIKEYRDSKMDEAIIAWYKDIEHLF